MALERNPDGSFIPASRSQKGGSTSAVMDARGVKVQRPELWSCLTGKLEWKIWLTIVDLVGSTAEVEWSPRQLCEEWGCGPWNFYRLLAKLEDAGLISAGFPRVGEKMNWKVIMVNPAAVFRGGPERLAKAKRLWADHVKHRACQKKREKVSSLSEGPGDADSDGVEGSGEAPGQPVPVRCVRAPRHQPEPAEGPVGGDLPGGLGQDHGTLEEDLEALFAES